MAEQSKIKLTTLEANNLVTIAHYGLEHFLKNKSPQSVLPNSVHYQAALRGYDKLCDLVVNNPGTDVEAKAMVPSSKITRY